MHYPDVLAAQSQLHCCWAKVAFVVPEKPTSMWSPRASNTSAGQASKTLQLTLNQVDKNLVLERTRYQQTADMFNVPGRMLSLGTIKAVEQPMMPEQDLCFVGC